MSTDVWGWVHDTHSRLVEDGQHRLATALAEIAGHAVDGRNEQLDAMFPEALASARALGLPWAEVFLRHWRLQNLLNKRHQGERAMAEAVSLLEFAHREETVSCPQAVCAVQDFTICHANIDGPGYVPERLAVLEETLARVEPARACYDCLSREYADTLEDDGRADDALAHLDRAQLRIQTSGARVSLAFGLARASALHRLGRDEEVLTALDTAEQAYVAARNILDEDDHRKLGVHRARALAALGRWEQALEQLPPAEEADEFPDIRHRWTDAVERLVAAGQYPNDVRLGVLLAGWVGYLDTAGSHRPCLELALTGARLAVRRRAGAVARALVDTGERKLALLRRADRAAAAQLAELRAAAEALGLPELPVPLGELLSWLADRPEPDGTPEADADLLTAAWAACGDDAALDPALATDLLLRLAGLLASLGHEHASAELLWARLEQEPDHQRLTGMLGSVLIEGRDAEGVQRLAALLARRSPVDAHWIRARWAIAESRWAEAVESCEALLVLEPDRINPRRLAAAAATELGDHATAQRFYQELLEHALPAEGTPPHEQYRTVQESDLWHLVTAATANRDWVAVRAAGARLGIDFEQPEGPVEEEWQLVTIRVRRTNGATTDLPAVRTGPATARILPVLAEDIPLNHGDVVVFGPALLEGLASEEVAVREGEQWRPTFELLTLLDPAGFTTYWLDGCWPGPQTWSEFRAAVVEAGFGVWAYSGEQYVITDPTPGKGELPGIYAALGVPPTASAAEADTLLQELTKGWEHPLSWLDLAKAAGVDPAPHQEIIERYGL